jgi:hypothetical protein
MLHFKWIGNIVRIFSWLCYKSYTLFKNVSALSGFSSGVLKKEFLAVSASIEKQNSLIPRSVNYHFTRQCNYECGFCFHTAKTSFVLPIDEAKRGLSLLRDAGKVQHIVCNIHI